MHHACTDYERTDDFANCIAELESNYRRPHQRADGLAHRFALKFPDNIIPNDLDSD